jgi:hypothetical protein
MNVEEVDDYEVELLKDISQLRGKQYEFLKTTELKPEPLV